MKVFNKGFNYSQDGPGNRLVYHLQGCNFRCKWCSNPEGIGKDNEKAIEYNGEKMLCEIMSCKPMFFDGGGVTFTGGEATLWADELIELFEKIHEKGINICLETNGSSKKLLELSELVDYLIMDIKHFDSACHSFWTGNNALIVYENFKKLCDIGKQMLVRIPLINNVNTDANRFVEFFKHYDCKNVKFEFLPYHEYGRVKWTQEYEINDGFITEMVYKEFKDKFIENNFKVIET